MTNAFDPRAFRTALSHFATGVVVVTAPGGGAPVAMTVSSFNAVSLDPPLILFSVSCTAPSLRGLLDAPHFAVSVLAQDQREISQRFSHAASDKWRGFAPSFSPSGCPLIRPSLASFECAPYADYDGGDHRIIVGRVLEFEASAEGAPLIFFRGCYQALHQPADL